MSIGVLVSSWLGKRVAIPSRSPRSRSRRRAGRGALAAFVATCALKALVDERSARRLRPNGFRLAQLAAVPLKDLLFGAAWAYGLVRRDVTWRGNRLRVLAGTRACRNDEVVGSAALAAP